LYTNLNFQFSKTRELFNKISSGINDKKKSSKIEEKDDGFVKSENSCAEDIEYQDNNSMHDETELYHGMQGRDLSFDDEFPYLYPASETSLQDYDYGKTSDFIDKIQVSHIKRLDLYVFFRYSINILIKNCN